MRLLLASVIAITFSACATPYATPEQRLLEVCEGYEGVLARAVTQGELGMLTLDQLLTIEQVDAVSGEICTGNLMDEDGTPMTVAEAIRVVEEAYTKLLRLQQKET